MQNEKIEKINYEEEKEEIAIYTNHNNIPSISPPLQRHTKVRAHLICRVCESSLPADLFQVHAQCCYSAHTKQIQPQELNSHSPSRSTSSPEPPRTLETEEAIENESKNNGDLNRMLEEIKVLVNLNILAQSSSLPSLGNQASPHPQLSVSLYELLSLAKRSNDRAQLEDLFHQLKSLVSNNINFTNPNASAVIPFFPLARLSAHTIKQKIKRFPTVKITSHSNSRNSSPTRIVPNPSSPSPLTVSPSRIQSSPASSSLPPPPPASPPSQVAARPDPSNSTPSSASLTFHPSSRAVSATPKQEPAQLPPQLCPAPLLTHSFSSPSESITQPSVVASSNPSTSPYSPSYTQPSPGPTNSALLPSATASTGLDDYHSLPYQAGRKALLETYLRGSTTNKLKSNKHPKVKKETNPAAHKGIIPNQAKQKSNRAISQNAIQPNQISPISNRATSITNQLVAHSDSPFNPAICLHDFTMIRCLSRGTASRVFLARKRNTGDLYAIKVMGKAEIVRKNNIERVMRERLIWTLSSSQHIVTLIYAFASKRNLYLVMEYMPGGDLLQFLHSRNPPRISEEEAKPIIMDIISAVDYLHSLGVIHRDVKCENIVRDSEGRWKLTDFGLSAVATHSTADPRSSSPSSSQQCHSAMIHPIGGEFFSGVGTHDYLAPEIIHGGGHTCNVDWWSVGVVIYEILTGVRPFNAESIESTYDRIIKRDIKWPTELSAEARDLIDRCLSVDPKERLGSKGLKEVQSHPFFKPAPAPRIPSVSPFTTLPIGYVGSESSDQRYGDVFHHNISLLGPPVASSYSDFLSLLPPPFDTKPPFFGSNDTATIFSSLDDSSLGLSPSNIFTSPCIASVNPLPQMTVSPPMESSPKLEVPLDPTPTSSSPFLSVASPLPSAALSNLSCLSNRQVPLPPNSILSVELTEEDEKEIEEKIRLRIESGVYEEAMDEGDGSDENLIVQNILNGSARSPLTPSPDGLVTHISPPVRPGRLSLISSAKQRIRRMHCFSAEDGDADSPLPSSPNLTPQSIGSPTPFRKENDISTGSSYAREEKGPNDSSSATINSTKKKPARMSPHLQERSMRHYARKSPGQTLKMKLTKEMLIQHTSTVNEETTAPKATDDASLHFSLFPPIQSHTDHSKFDISSYFSNSSILTSFGGSSPPTSHVNSALSSFPLPPVASLSPLTPVPLNPSSDSDCSGSEFASDFSVESSRSEKGQHSKVLTSESITSNNSPSISANNVRNSSGGWSDVTGSSNSDNGGSCSGSSEIDRSDHEEMEDFFMGFDYKNINSLEAKNKEITKYLISK